MHLKVNVWIARLRDPQMKCGTVTPCIAHRHDRGLTARMLCGLLRKHTCNVWLCLSQRKTVIEQPLPNLWANRKPNVCLETFQLGSRIKSRKMIIYISTQNLKKGASYIKMLKTSKRPRGDKRQEILPWFSLANPSSSMWTKAAAAPWAWRSETVGSWDQSCGQRVKAPP